MLVQHDFPYPPVYGRALLCRTSHERVPLLDVLQDATTRHLVPFTTPGHKQDVGADAELVELLGKRIFANDIWLNTAHLAQAMQEAEDLAADAWGAEWTRFLINGSSSGNQAFLFATLQDGDEVVIGRDIHSSILTALIQTGARPVYVTPRFHSETGLSLGVAPQDMARALEDHPSAKLVIVTSPNYYGVAMDLPAVVRAAHTRDVPVYVDEAWGPHFSFSPLLPPSAMESGADSAVTSAHKLLGSLSQSALLNLQGVRLDRQRISTAVSMLQTTSPLLPLFASIDTARRQMALHGECLLSKAIDLAEEARRRLAELPGVRVLDGHRMGIPYYDRTRLLVDVHGLGISGYEAERTLRQRFGIAPEMSDQASVLCLVTVGDTHASISKLITAFRNLACERRYATPLQAQACPRSLGDVVSANPQTMTPREAYHRPSRAVALSEAVGATAAEAIVPYPPGVPVLTPGEVITNDKLDYLAHGLEAGMYVRGAADPTLATIRVVA